MTANLQTASERSVLAPSGARLFTVPSWEVDSWWEHVAHHVERWTDYDQTWTPAEVREEMKAARAQLWCFHAQQEIKGIWVTRLEQTDDHAWGVVWGCAGDFVDYKDDAVAFFGIIEDWMKQMGCEFVEWTGRDGWHRIFPDYRKHAVILRKRL